MIYEYHIRQKTTRKKNICKTIAMKYLSFSVTMPEIKNIKCKRNLSKSLCCVRDMHAWQLIIYENLMCVNI